MYTNFDRPNVTEIIFNISHVTLSSLTHYIKSFLQNDPFNLGESMWFAVLNSKNELEKIRLLYSKERYIEAGILIDDEDVFISDMSNNYKGKKLVFYHFVSALSDKRPMYGGEVCYLNSLKGKLESRTNVVLLDYIILQDKMNAIHFSYQSSRQAKALETLKKRLETDY